MAISAEIIGVRDKRHGDQGDITRHDIPRPNGPHNRQVRTRPGRRRSAQGRRAERALHRHRRHRLRPARVLWLADRHAQHRQARQEWSPVRRRAHDRALLAGRLCIVHGRNHHSNAMSCITEGSTGYPGGNGAIRFENGFLSDMLLQQGYATYAIGKWHLTPAEQVSAAGPYDRWPLARGFERYYGFLGGDTHQYYPDLVYDNHQVEPPKTPEEGYHLTADLADQGDRLHRRPEAGRAGQAVLPLFRAGREPCAPSCAEGMGGQIQGQVRRGLGRLSREGVRAAESARHHAQGRQALAPRSRRSGVGQAAGRPAQALCADDGGVRGLLRAHGPSCRPADRFPRPSRRTRQYADHVHLRQWRELGRRSERLGQREQVLQQRAR